MLGLRWCRLSRWRGGERRHILLTVPVCWLYEHDDVRNAFGPGEGRMRRFVPLKLAALSPFVEGVVPIGKLGDLHRLREPRFFVV